MERNLTDETMDYDSSPALFQKHILRILSFGALSERFSYYGALTILVLYLSKTFSFTDQRSYSLYGFYATLAFAMPIIGGIVADRIFGAKQALFIGGLFLIVGNILLFIPHYNFLCIGLAFTIWGSALFKGNAASLVGKINKDNASEKEYTVFYIAMNIGGLLGPILYGIASQTLGWHGSFITSAILITLWQILFIFNFKNIPETKINTFSKRNFTIQNIKKVTYFLIFACSFITAYLLFLNIVLTDFLILFSAVSLAALLGFAFRQTVINRNRILGLILLCIFAMLFFSASLQVVSSISLFIERDVQRTLLGWTIPTPLFSALYPLFVIIIAPLVVQIWSYFKNKNTPIFITTKFIIALLFACLGFVFFSLATSSIGNEHYQALLWIVLGNLCLGTGEICLMPTALSAISQFSPENLRGTMMGFLFLFIAFAGYLSSLLAKTTDIHTTNLHSTEIYTHGFIIILMMALIAAIVLFLFKPAIRALLQPLDSQGSN